MSEIILNASLMQQGNFIDVFLSCCIKLAFQIISWGRCTVKQPSSLHEWFTLRISFSLGH